MKRTDVLMMCAATEAFTDRDGWSAMSAVREGRVHFALSYFRDSAECFITLQLMAEWLYPGLFEDLDPDAEMKSFCEEFIPMISGGVWSYGMS
ncbi:MAG: hypothetical protein LBJ20_02720 [Candidatus Methanoplasma sp.]|jgi:iron complex transport system substrate-binding protein|nr:hypothetical protein [Candidatus Methanoplasma sp.]